jgi:hypothetical protein
MKTRHIRAFVFTSLALLLVAIAAPDALAQINIAATGFTSTTVCSSSDVTAGCLVETNGSAVATGGALQLTPAITGQMGSAWFATQQAVAGPFSTTFTFQLSGGNTTQSPADGIAFVIQNSALTALGPDGCGIGFGDSAYCTSSTGGIPNSLAVEFNTYENPSVDTSNNDVTIQSCPVTEANPTGANSVDPTCTIAVNNSLLNASNQTITLADGNVHMVTITYTPSTLATCGEGGTTNCSSLDVLLDSTDLFPGGVLVNLSTLLSLASGNNAYIGFTAATGGGDDNQDILSWTFTPQAQSAVVSATGATFSFPTYAYTAQLTSGSPQVVQVGPTLMTPSACDALVQKKFWPARCFVYENAENSTAASAIFTVTCPQAPGGLCTSFYAELGTNFQLLYSQNPLFVYPGILGPVNPFPGFLKGPITSAGPQFVSNQVLSFIIDGPQTHGQSGGTGSYWVATYLTPGEALPGITITPFAPGGYAPNATITANYACSNPSTSQPLTGAIGPYLTAASCTANVLGGTMVTQSCPTFTPVPGPGPGGGGLTCTATFTAPAKKGSYIFEVTAIDSGHNQNANAVPYKVN